MKIPLITIELNGDTDCWELMATSYLRSEPAGPRLFRGGDLPDIQFSHVDQTDAERDRAALQRYVDLAWSGKAPKAKGREEAEEVPAKTADLSGAWWND